MLMILIESDIGKNTREQERLHARHTHHTHHTQQHTPRAHKYTKQISGLSQTFFSIKDSSHELISCAMREQNLKYPRTSSCHGADRRPCIWRKVDNSTADEASAGKGSFSCPGTAGQTPRKFGTERGPFSLKGGSGASAASKRVSLTKNMALTRSVSWVMLFLVHSAASGFSAGGGLALKQSRPAYLACLDPSGMTFKGPASVPLKTSLNDLSAQVGGSGSKTPRSFSTGSLNKLDVPMMRIPRSPSSYFRKHFPNTVLSASPPPGDVSTDNVDHLDGRTEFIAECKLPTEKGTFLLRSYRYKGAKIVVRNGERVLEWTEMEPVVVVHGDLRGKERVLVRVHDQCFTSEVLGSKRCDCKEQLDMAMLHIMQNEGAIIYMPQEGRGIGLANKIAAYQLQDGGLDTVDANRHLGFEDDERSYSCVPFILQDMGIKTVQLITNNPYKITQLRDNGVQIDRVTPSIVVPNQHNLKYLRTKAERMAHLLSLDKLKAPKTRAVSPVGPDSLKSALDTLREGGMAMLVRGEGTHLEAALVVRADLASAELVSDMSRVSDSFVTAVLPPQRWDELQLGAGDGQTAPITLDLLGMAAEPFSCQGRSETLRALADTSIKNANVRQPGFVFARKAMGGWSSIVDGALELVRMAGGSVGCVSLLSSPDGLRGPTLMEVMQISESLSVSVALAEDAERGLGAPS